MFTWKSKWLIIERITVYHIVEYFGGDVHPDASEKE